jgi:pentatricopeptide repeat protein
MYELIEFFSKNAYLKHHVARPSLSAINHLLKHLSRVSPRSVEPIFNDMLAWGENAPIKPDSSSYFHLLKALARLGRADKALVVLNMLLHQTSQQQIKPSAAMFNVVIGALLMAKSPSSSSFKKNAAQLFDEMITLHGLWPDIHTCNAMIHAYSVIGDIEGAMKVLDFIRQTQDTSLGVGPAPKAIFANDITFNLIVSLLSSKKLLYEAEMVVENMVSCGLRPTAVTLNALS